MTVIDQINIPITEDDIEMFKHLVNRGELLVGHFGQRIVRS